MIDFIRSAANPSFRFVVKIGELEQAVFTECTPPTMEWEVQEIKEGGMNGYSHRLPVRQKGARITLKNGLGRNDLFDWCVLTTAMGDKFERKLVTITLQDVARKAMIVWTMANAYPVKWTAPSLKSDDTTLAIQTLELVGDAVTVERVGESPQKAQEKPYKIPSYVKKQSIGEAIEETRRDVDSVQRTADYVADDPTHAKNLA